MTTNKIILQPAFVLHTRPYRDTSLLVDLLTLQFGKLTAVARGVHGIKSRFRGILSPFLPLLVSFSGKSDLRTLQQAETNGISYALGYKALLSGFYLNELLVKLLPVHESYTEIYHAYQNALEMLVQYLQPEIALRIFEKKLLVNLGYGLQLNYTASQDIVEPEEKYIFEFGIGLKLAKPNSPMCFLGRSLLALHAENINTEDELRDAKRLLRGIFSILLENKKLKSRELFKPKNVS